MLLVQKACFTASTSPVENPSSGCTHGERFGQKTIEAARSGHLYMPPGTAWEQNHCPSSVALHTSSTGGQVEDRCTRPKASELM